MAGLLLVRYGKMFFKTVTENQEAVMSFFYTDASNQVCPSASDGSYDNMSTGQGDGDLRRDPD